MSAKHMNVIIANGNNLLSFRRNGDCGDAFKECCAALYFVDMRLRRDHLRHTEITEAQFNPSFIVLTVYVQAASGAVLRREWED